MRRLLRRALMTLLVVLAVISGWSAMRASTPITAFRREIVIDAPRQVVWDHFLRVTEWHTWLPGTTADASPTPILGPTSIVTLHQQVDTTFHMVEFDAPNHWMWTTKMLGMTLLYDHEFTALTDRRTRLVFDMRVTGFGNVLFAPLLGLASKSMHATALPALKREIEALPAR